VTGPTLSSPVISPQNTFFHLKEAYRALTKVRQPSSLMAKIYTDLQFPCKFHSRATPNVRILCSYEYHPFVLC
ncbi:hypothetical protein L9F63_021726, partial [Diploptera punctata]